MPDSSITQRLTALDHQSTLALRRLARLLLKKRLSTKLRRELMLRIVAHILQEQELGGLSDASVRRLRHLAEAFEADPNVLLTTSQRIKPGTRLVRQWKEQVHVVEVEPEGYGYKGSRYESLSEIARLITGTRWSGPVFFGLKGKQSKESRRPNER